MIYAILILIKTVGNWKIIKNPEIIYWNLIYGWYSWKKKLF
jgi:hypothetical protein